MNTHLEESKVTCILSSNSLNRTNILQVQFIEFETCQYLNAQTY